MIWLYLYLGALGYAIVCRAIDVATHIHSVYGSRLDYSWVWRVPLWPVSAPTDLLVLGVAGVFNLLRKMSA